MIPLCLRFRDFLLPFHFLSFVFCPLHAIQLSVFSFPLFLGLPHSGYPSARLSFRFLAFTFLFDLISHVNLPGSCTWLPVCFLSLYPVLLPQPFDRWFLSNFSFRTIAWLPLSFVHFRFSNSLLSFCFFRSLLPGFVLQWLFQCFSSSFRFHCVPPYLPSGFPFFFSGFWYLAFCLFPFILPGFTPTAVSPVLPSVHFLASVSLSGLSANFPLSFVRFIPLLITWLSDFLFPSSRFALSAVQSKFISSLVQPVAMLSLGFWYSASCNSFLQHSFASQWLL